MRLRPRAAATAFTLLTLGSATAAVMVYEACTPAQAVTQGVDLSLVVLRGLLNHETLAQIEADVRAALVAMDASVTEIDVAAVVEDALTLLLDSGLIPPDLLPVALSMRTEAHGKRKTSPAAVHPQ